MFKFLYNLFFSSESEKLKNQIAKKYEQAIVYQRNGNIAEYSSLMSEISNLEDSLAELQE
jgi:hypothetical protein|tara:strand:- start:192 stop:371 length:180 start_codon:yes stop_codon:yes gene_type:complete